MVGVHFLEALIDVFYYKNEMLGMHLSHAPTFIIEPIWKGKGYRRNTSLILLSLFNYNIINMFKHTLFRGDI